MRERKRKERESEREERERETLLEPRKERKTQISAPLSFTLGFVLEKGALS